MPSALPSAATLCPAFISLIATAPLSRRSREEPPSVRHDTEEMGSTLRGSRERDEEEHNGRARHVCSAKHASTIRLDDDAAPREGGFGEEFARENG